MSSKELSEVLATKQAAGRGASGDWRALREGAAKDGPVKKVLKEYADNKKADGKRAEGVATVYE